MTSDVIVTKSVIGRGERKLRGRYRLVEIDRELRFVYDCRSNTEWCEHTFSFFLALKEDLPQLCGLSHTSFFVLYVWAMCKPKWLYFEQHPRVLATVLIANVENATMQHGDIHYGSILRCFGIIGPPFQSCSH